MRILIYAQHTSRGSQICYDEDQMNLQKEEISDDLICYEGDKKNLKEIAEAYIEAFAKDNNSNTYFNYKVAENILAEINEKFIPTF